MSDIQRKDAAEINRRILALLYELRGQQNSMADQVLCDVYWLAPPDDRPFGVRVSLKPEAGVVPAILP